MFWETLAKKGADFKSFSQNVLVLQLIHFSGFGENWLSSFLSIQIRTNRHFEKKKQNFSSGQYPKTDISNKVSTFSFLFLPYFLYNIVGGNEKWSIIYEL